MAEAATAEAGTAALVVLYGTWAYAMRYATTPGHAAKPRVVREDGPEGPRWAVHAQVRCAVSAAGGPPPPEEPPRATGPDPRDFWRLLRAR